jgi:hypothetical protein
VVNPEEADRVREVFRLYLEGTPVLDIVRRLDGLGWRNKQWTTKDGKVVRPAELAGQRASALRFGDQRVQALFAVLVVFSFQLRGFNNREMRVLLAQLLGLDPANYPIGRMTYDLRRLRLHGIIERIPHSHRYQLSPDGLRIALFFSRAYARLLRPKLAEIIPRPEPIPSALRIAFDRLNSAIDTSCEEARLAA